MAAVALSIVIPALNEAPLIAEALRRLADLAPDAECIVADGGSTDGTAQAAEPWARVLSSGRGRAKQMNAGAQVATGTWLLFLHVDTELPRDFAGHIRLAEARGFKVGAFSLRIAGRHPLLPVLAWGATLRTRLRGIAFGDQALFVRRSFFLERGGFPDLPLMEDLAWTRELRRTGVRLFLSPAHVTTSGRRWDRDGFWSTWWHMRRNQWRFSRSRDVREFAATYRDVR